MTDDRALTRAILHDAGSLGAEIRFNTTFEHAAFDPEACRADCFGPAGKETITARAVVNAGGPWVNRILEHVTPRPTPLDIELVQGTHIIVPGSLKQGIYYLEAPRDRRAIFIMPWRDQIMIGTTETPYRGDPADVRPLEEEQTYLLEVYNHYFSRKLRPDDVIASFAGLRVLPASHTRAFNRSRDTILHCDDNTPRLLSIYGGKLTSHAHTAAEVMKRLAKILRTG